MKRVFRDIFLANHWASPESISGIGSEMGATVQIRRELPRIFRQYSVKVFLDAPCGDFNWMKAVDLSGVHYVGIDIVDELAASCRWKYESDRREFYSADITKDALPVADLVLCKDCLIHLCFADCLAALRNFKRHGIRLLMSNTNPEVELNVDKPTGDYRRLNLQAAPFNFPAPLESFPWNDAVMGLWDISQLPLPD